MISYVRKLPKKESANIKAAPLGQCLMMNLVPVNPKASRNTIVLKVGNLWNRKMPLMA